MSLSIRRQGSRGTSDPARHAWGTACGHATQRDHACDGVGAAERLSLAGRATGCSTMVDGSSRCAARDTRWHLGTGASGTSARAAWNRNPVQRCSTGTRSPPVPSMAMHEATTGGTLGQETASRGGHAGAPPLRPRASCRSHRSGRGMVVLTTLLGTRPRLPVLWAERGSAGHPFTPGVNAHRDGGLHIVTHVWTGIRGVWAPEGTNVDGDTILPAGVPVRPTRGIGERPVSWLTRSRRLSRDGEAPPPAVRPSSLGL